MKIVSTIYDLEIELNKFSKSKTLGFIPTMGALHQGHITLVQKSIVENDFTICSIFVNPTQFNNIEDLEKYPNQLGSDFNLLKEVGCDYVFTPSTEEIYPPNFNNKNFEFGALDKVMEGTNRPGHFNGVAMVISRLFELIMPQKAYFGEKDFQQLVIVQSLVKQANLVTQIVPCATAREKSGLAMSSRNSRLNIQQNLSAPRIYERLLEVSKRSSVNSIAEIKCWIENAFHNDKDLRLEYFEISHPASLQPSENWENSNTHIACIAVFAGEVRLIDNILLKIN
tara:strand:- start:1736 stop:2584 length:849 start_codon:yes stop_codon:yes gene_type:complete